MKKNVLFWCGLKSEDPHLRKKHGNFEYLDISKKCWQYWCEKNDVIFSNIILQQNLIQLHIK